MEFEDKIVIVTGGAHGIGLCIADEFRKAGTMVYVIDKLPGNHFKVSVNVETIISIVLLSGILPGSSR